jgi:hypothetical protein
VCVVPRATRLPTGVCRHSTGVYGTSVSGFSFSHTWGPSSASEMPSGVTNRRLGQLAAAIGYAVQTGPAGGAENSAAADTYRLLLNCSLR